MAKKPKKSKSGFDLNDLLEYLGNVTGKTEASGYANLGSGVNAQLTKTLPVAANKTARGLDSFALGGLGAFATDSVAGKPVTKGRVAGTATNAALTFAPYGKLAKLAGPVAKTARTAVDAAKQLRLLNMLFNEF